MSKKSALLILNSITLLVFLLLLYNYIHEQNNQLETNQQAVMRVATQQINKMFSKLSTIAHTMADDLTTGKLQRTQIMERLETNLEKTPYQYGMGVAYVPYVNTPEMRRRSPYYLKSFKNQEESLLEFTVPCFYREPTTQMLLQKCVVFVDYSKKMAALPMTVAVTQNQPKLSHILIKLLPLFVILGMLFAILLLLGKVKSFSKVIAPLILLFLATILAHIGLKTEINPVNPWEFTYLDYFYLVTYIAILAVVSSYLIFYNNRT